MKLVTSVHLAHSLYQSLPDDNKASTTPPVNILWLLALITYDAVILDLALPDGDGLSLLRGMRARRSMLPVVVLTARDGPEDRVTGLDSGADDYLVKPVPHAGADRPGRAVLRRPDAALGAGARAWRSGRWTPRPGRSGGGRRRRSSFRRARRQCWNCCCAARAAW